ncbi:hypothetical protein GCM10011507_02870 [Edaphobacter acidisoli]|uniref:Uncharacterized protein n=1 Tax=Edaphobacter acidisoli TaxID=2040573 RepID=A0A916RI18_9BACT|nr:hypothetical protein GCM10011507_02870 [Edaphobacter acidisoli]
MIPACHRNHPMAKPSLLNGAAHPPNEARSHLSARAQHDYIPSEFRGCFYVDF